MRNFGRILKHDATVEDLRQVSDGLAVELINGELVEKAAPSFEHGFTQAAIITQVGPHFGGPSGPGGGWWIVSEVEVSYEATQIFRHDLVAWRRARMPERPKEWPVPVRPDWACEILSPSNASNDTVKKLRVLHRHHVPHYWLVDPEAGTLTVLRWADAGYLTVLTAEAGERVAAEPFEAVELDLSALFEGRFK